MPTNLPYPGETQEEFMRRQLAQREQMTLPFQYTPMTDQQFEAITRSGIQSDPLMIADAFNMPGEQRVPLAQEDPANVPFTVPDMQGDPRFRSGVESRGSQGPGAPDVDMPDVSGLYRPALMPEMPALPEALSDPRSDFWTLPRVIGETFLPDPNAQWQETVEGIKQYGLIPRLGQIGDAALRESEELAEPVTRILFGPPAGSEEEQTGGVSQPAAPYTGGFGPPGQAGGGAGASTEGESGGRTFSRTVQLPETDELISQDEIPRLSRDALDQFISRLEQAKPEEFEGQDVDDSRLLATMGQSLAQAGRAPTLGQALLALGTGGQTAIAQHEQEQEELARQRMQQINEAERAIADAAFSGEMSLDESERAAQQLQLNRERVLANLAARRDQAINSAHDVQVSGDNIVISRPTVNEDGTMTVTTEVISPEAQQSMMDQVALGAGLEDLELPDVGGVAGEKRLAMATSPEQRLNVFTAMQLATGELPPERIQAEGGVEYINSLKRMAELKLAQSLGLDKDATRSQIANQYNTVYKDSDFSADDALEGMFYRELQSEMARNPTFARAVWAGAGWGQ